MAGAGYKLFATGDVLTAAQVNTYLMQQTVMVFASSAARTAALSGVLAEGMVSYLQDTNSLEVYDGSAWIGATGDITALTAGTGISISSATGPIPTVAIDSTVATLTGSQTLTNKTLTAPLINLAFNAQTGTSYTLVASDSGKLVSLSNAAGITLTLPISVYAAGEQINIIATGTGQVTLAAASGATIVSTGATSAAPKLRVQYSAATIICQTGGATPTFYVVGDLA